MLKYKKNLYIFGTGLYGEKFAVYFSIKKKRIFAFLDSNPNKCGQLFYGVKVISPENLLTKFPQNAVILIASKRYASEIEEKLEKYGLKNGDDFINPFVKESGQLSKYREIANRLERAEYFNEQNLNLNSKNVFTKIYKQNIWRSAESRSGFGSQINTTKKIRAALPNIWKKYSIKTFLDIPCGDFNWMKEVDKKGIEYIGADIVEEIISSNNKLHKDKYISFKVLDAAKDKLPKADMIFCKDCLQHLSYENVWRVLRNFKRSGAKYLLVTSYPLTLKNWDISDGGGRPLNLQIAPFCFPKPLLKILEPKGDSTNEIDKTMFLYELNNLYIPPPPTPRVTVSAPR